MSETQLTLYATLILSALCFVVVIYRLKRSKSLNWIVLLLAGTYMVAYYAKDSAERYRRIREFEALDFGRLLRQDSGYLLPDFSLFVMTGFIDFLLLAIPVFIIIWIAWRLFLTTENEKDPLTDITDQQTLTNSVTRILDSEKFLVALRTSLPKGQSDEVYGLDYVPFMLHTIDERRKRFARSAASFLAGTIVLGVLFSFVVVYFGYILVNEASVGASRSLAEIVPEARAISQSLDAIRPGFFSNEAFQEIAGESLDKLELTLPGEANREIKVAIDSAINDARRTGNLLELSKTLESSKAKVSTKNNEETQYAAALDKAFQDTSRFIGSKDAVLLRLVAEVENLNRVTAKAEEVLSKPENRVPELLKRLALGVVVASFFFAILRYVGGLYRSHYQQMLKTEAEDLAVRRFYIAYKSSGSSDEQRHAVISSFMVGIPATEVSAQPERSITKEQFDIVKEVFATLSKKL